MRLGIFIIAVTLGVYYQGENNINMSPEEELMKVDAEFSAYSKINGRNNAFIKYCHDEGVMLVQESMPIEGKNSITGWLMEKQDTSYVLTWKPVHATCASSGELGYTYGIWTMQNRSSEPDKKAVQGTYVTIWKKNNKGEWKFILDTGNPGLEEKSSE